MESVAKSKYFKSIAETKYVQKAIAGVSGMKLRLLLEIKSCIGTITVNVPPPPNDRIWYNSLKPINHCHKITFTRLPETKNFLHGIGMVFALFLKFGCQPNLKLDIGVFGFHK